MKVKRPSVISKVKNILNCAEELHQLAKIRNGAKIRKKIAEVRDCVINAISELADNCLRGNIPLKKSGFKKLSLFKKLLRKLRRKTKVKTRRNLLIQQGGFAILPLLIPPALSLLASVVGSAINKKL